LTSGNQLFRRWDPALDQEPDNDKKSGIQTFTENREHEKNYLGSHVDACVGGFPAYAASNVTLYGVVDTGLGYEQWKKGAT